MRYIETAGIVKKWEENEAETAQSVEMAQGRGRKWGWSEAETAGIVKKWGRNGWGNEMVEVRQNSVKK